MHRARHYIITVTCPAASGIVAAISTFLATSGCYISEMAQFDDESNEQFFMRTVFRSDSADQFDVGEIEVGMEVLGARFQMQWEIHPSDEPMRVLLMVSKYDHCLTDLLDRRRKGELNMEITAIVSNHPDLQPLAEREGIRFIQLRITSENKISQEMELLSLVRETHTELVVLARYMQILSNDLCKALSGRAINIHHSFLPGFKGAKPYHQAWDRGVKLIGATAHYVTSDLDEGPIIEQEVQRVDHAQSAEELVAVGRDTETVVLSKAVKWHTERRVFLNKSRTVIFR